MQPPGMGARMRALVAEAVAALDEESRASIAKFVTSARADGGGFLGLGARADLYYDTFGYSLLRVFGGEPHEGDLRHLVACEGAATHDLVHLTALLRARALVRLPPDTERWAPAIERFRTSDGTYRQKQDGPIEGQIYPTFLAELAYEAICARPDPAPDIPALVHHFRTSEGGCCGAAGGPSVVPVTAAAIALLDAHDAPVPPEAIRWLAGCRDPRTGGIKAAHMAPAPDLLSTAVSLYALHTQHAIPGDWLESTGTFIQACWRFNGGFGGRQAGDDADVEFTWYAMLGLGCLLAAG